MKKENVLFRENSISEKYSRKYFRSSTGCNYTVEDLTTRVPEIKCSAEPIDSWVAIFFMFANSDKFW